MLAFWHLQNRYQIFTTSSSLPTYSHRKNALKFFILLSITLQKKQSVTTNYQMSQAVAGLSSISVTDRYVSIINFLKMPNASLPLRLLLAYKPMRCSKTRAHHQQRSHTLPSFFTPKPHAFSKAKFLKFLRLYTYWSSSFAFRMKEPTAVVASVKRASHWYHACKNEVSVVK